MGHPLKQLYWPVVEGAGSVLPTLSPTASERMGHPAKKYYTGLP